MAKATFGAGKFRGKVGGFVYRNDAGVGNVVSEYNPHPSNPRTLAQVRQRSKMNLAGKISSLTPYSAIAGMGVRGRDARSAFVSSIIKATTNTRTTGTTEGGRSTIEMKNVVFSKGNILPITSTLAFNEAGTAATVNITVPEEITNLLGLRVIFLYGSLSEWKGLEVVNLSSERTASIDLAFLNAADQVCNVAAWVVPVVDKGEAARAAFGALIAVGTEKQAETTYTRSLQAVNAFEHSLFVGAEDNDD